MGVEALISDAIKKKWQYFIEKKQITPIPLEGNTSIILQYDLGII